MLGLQWPLDFALAVRRGRDVSCAVGDDYERVADVSENFDHDLVEDSVTGGRVLNFVKQGFLKSHFAVGHEVKPPFQETS